MSDFEAALRKRLTRNAELAEQRARAEREMDRAKREAAEAEARRQQELAEARLARHDELVAHLRDLTQQLRASAPESFVVRSGWTESGEEFITRISSRGLYPARSLFIELDRDDDEVLVRWAGDLGSSLELWRLLEVGPEVLTELVLQVADQDLWRDLKRPPPFPA